MALAVTLLELILAWWVILSLPAVMIGAVTTWRFIRAVLAITDPNPTEPPA